MMLRYDGPKHPSYKEYNIISNCNYLVLRVLHKVAMGVVVVVVVVVIVVELRQQL